MHRRCKFGGNLLYTFQDVVLTVFRGARMTYAWTHARTTRQDKKHYVTSHTTLVGGIIKQHRPTHKDLTAFEQVYSVRLKRLKHANRIISKKAQYFLAKFLILIRDIYCHWRCKIYYLHYRITEIARLWTYRRRFFFNCTDPKLRPQSSFRYILNTR